jgi:hypothetical protein
MLRFLLLSRVMSGALNMFELLLTIFLGTVKLLLELVEQGLARLLSLGGLLLSDILDLGDVLSQLLHLLFSGGSSLLICIREISHDLVSEVFKGLLLPGLLLLKRSLPSLIQTW